MNNKILIKIKRKPCDTPHTLLSETVKTKKAISLFSGAGGDTLGLERASYHVVAFSEHIKTFAETHQKMFPHSELLSHHHTTDIRQIPNQIFEQYHDQIDLIFAGFPCQSYSQAGKKNENDPRGELVYEFVRVVQCVRPEWIMGENVRGLLSRKGVYPLTKEKLPVIEIIRKIFENIGYSITWSLVDSSNFGVAQTRKRLIIVGHDNMKTFSDLIYPHINWEKCQCGERVTLRSLLENTLEGAMEFPIDHIPENINPNTWIITDLTSLSETHLVHPNLIRLVKGIRNKSTKELQVDQNPENKTIVNSKGLISFGHRSSGYHGEVVDPDQPCKTIICTYGTCPRLFVGLHNPVIHKYWIRPFTLSELAQIQSFPKDYQFQGNTKEIITQIGNAVPSNIVCGIANQLPHVVFKSYPQEHDIKHLTVSDEDDS